jgi:hypothetical protein
MSTVRTVLMSPTFNDLNKYEWLVLMTGITDHCRLDPARFEQLRELVEMWEDHPLVNMPNYDVVVRDQPGSFQM